MSDAASSGGSGTTPPTTVSGGPAVSNGSDPPRVLPTAQALDGELVPRASAAAAVSPKVTWAAVASALATLIWTLVASLAPTAFSAASIATLTGASATVLTFLGAYFARDPLRDH